MSDPLRAIKINFPTWFLRLKNTSSTAWIQRQVALKVNVSFKIGSPKQGGWHE
ncbi:MAG: hypothetical protein IPN44_08845 [Flavobacteriales bacterium]|nr:hypothetical protein [Flavobacteriales bacterium]